MTSPFLMRWRDVAATRCSAERDEACAIAAEALRSVDEDPRAPPWSGRRRIHYAERIDARFLAAYGETASGWRWSREGGGVVRAWCCPRHSIPDPANGARLSPEQRSAIAMRAASALLEWFGHVAAVREIVETAAPPSDAVRVDRAVRRLADLAAQTTGCSDAWYAHASQIIGWYLERNGVHGAAEIARAAIRGRFESWVEPSASAVDHVVHSIADRCVAAVDTDALAEHRAMRIDWLAPPPDIAAREAALGPDVHEDPIDDAHLDAVVRLDVDREEGAARADRMCDALGWIVDHARRAGATLSLDVLRYAHAVAIGVAPPSRLRSAPAYAKAGREVYGVPRDGFSALELAPRANGMASLVARVYLDVIFWHPFEDGNARAARLAVAWLDAHHRIGFADLVPAFSVPRLAGDVDAAWDLVRTLLSAAERRRAR